MERFFKAKNIAVIGASRNPNKVGGVIFSNLLKNENLKVFPINPKASHIEGIKAFKDILEVPFNIDLAVIVIKAEFVLDILNQCIQKDIKNFIIISAGFSEIGNVKLQEKLNILIDENKLNVIGPNVLGIINPFLNLNASFFKRIPKPGNIAFISQSGALGTAILDKFNKIELGISGFVSLGNMVDKDFISALDYFGKDKNTKIITLYIESLKEDTGKEFISLCKKISKHKKIIAIKSGKTMEGKKAA